MITLYAAGPGFGLPDMSPHVTKTEVQLKMAGLAYAKAQARPDASPKGQLPFIDDDGELVADSTFIRAHLEEKYGVDFDVGLTPAERAQAWAIERMVENHLLWTAAYFRFLDADNFARGPATWFDQAPEAMRAQLCEGLLTQVKANLKVVGVGRHAPEEVVELGERSLAALAAMLGRKPYLMGDIPCGADAIAFAVLANILTPYFDTPLRRRAEAHPVLVDYVGRMMARHYPAHPWEVQPLTASNRRRASSMASTRPATQPHNGSTWASSSAPSAVRA